MLNILGGEKKRPGQRQPVRRRRRHALIRAAIEVLDRGRGLLLGQLGLLELLGAASHSARGSRESAREICCTLFRHCYSTVRPLPHAPQAAGMG